LKDGHEENSRTLRSGCSLILNGLAGVQVARNSARLAINYRKVWISSLGTISKSLGSGSQA